MLNLKKLSDELDEVLSRETTESLNEYLNRMKEIYLIQLIESESDRILFATFDEENAKRYAKKANKMIEKWTKYWDKKSDNPFFDDNHSYAFNRWHQWFEVRKVRVIKTTVR